MEYRIPEDDHWWFASRTRALKAIMDRLLPQTPDFRLLDVGGGAGNVIHHLSHYGQVKGIERRKPDEFVVDLTRRPT